VRENPNDHHGTDRTTKEEKHYLFGPKPGINEISGHDQWKRKTQSRDAGENKQKQGDQCDGSLDRSGPGGRKSSATALAVFQPFYRIDPTSRTVHICFLAPPELIEILMPRLFKGGSSSTNEPSGSEVRLNAPEFRGKQHNNPRTEANETAEDAEETEETGALRGLCG